MLPEIDRRQGRATDTDRFRYQYQVYGLTVKSELELPELVPASSDCPDVTIRFGSVPAEIENVIGQWTWCMASPSEFVFTIDGIARFHIAAGKIITIERRLGAPESVSPADLRLWLLGSAFAALIHQRGQLPLHVSAVNAPSGVWAFTGDSGEGKSTLAGFLHRRYGWELVSDDVSVVNFEPKGPIIHPGPRKLKLWVDALDHLNFEGLIIARDLSNTEKYQLYLPSGPDSQSRRIHSLVVLESADDNTSAVIERLRGIEAFEACLSAVFRPYMQRWFKLPDKRLAELANLCHRIEVYRFRRPRSLKAMHLHASPLIELMVGNNADRVS